MNSAAITPETLANSVIAVPPLARDDDFSLSKSHNQQIVRHLEGGGVSTLLYGGNANLYHIRPSEYLALLQMLEEIAGENTTMIPAVGPAYGVMMDQAEMLRGTSFPTAMVLPHQGLTTDLGVQRGICHFAERIEKPVVIYLKHENYLSVERTRELVDEGVVSWIKYAIVRDVPSDDDELRRLVDVVDPKIVVSGIGEQPAIVHLNEFGVGAFTSGCVCLAPRLSQEMLRAIQNSNLARAEEIRGIFKKLEDLRNEINPIKVLHHAVQFAGIANTGPILPLLSEVEEDSLSRIREAAQSLFAEN